MSAAQAPHCDHYWAWVSPAGARGSARICISCHQPDPEWLNEIDALAAKVADAWDEGNRAADQDIANYIAWERAVEVDVYNEGTIDSPKAIPNPYRAALTEDAS